jgi:voltage-gated potassium channel Kch
MIAIITRLPEGYPVKKPSISERFRYWFDGYMSRGTIALIGLLAIVTVAFILIISLIVVAIGKGPGDEAADFGETLWNSMLRTLDPGTMGGDEGKIFRLLMLVVTIGGLIIVASLIGIISGAFDSKVEELRKGRSRVLETEHTVILGWSQKVFPIISEIVIANESRGKSAIVVLAEGDKVEMEDEIRARIPHTGKTKIIVRTGDPMDLTDLELANPHTARSIIIVAPENSTDPDSVVVKTALALTNNPRRGEKKFHIVGEIQEPGYMEAAQLVGRDEAHWVLASDLISRITVQSCRQSGLSVVYQELLDFDGDEIYFTVQPSLVGSSYLEAQYAFADAAVIGLSTAAGVTMNPAADTTLSEGDQLIVIASDDSAIKLSPRGAADSSVIATAKVPAGKPERTLVLGYNSGLHALLRELSEYVPAKSSVTVVADVEVSEIAKYSNMAVTVQKDDSTSRAVLEKLSVKDFDHIIVLAYREHLQVQQADAKTLFTLLHLRDIEEQQGTDLNIVSEMLDDRNRELAEVTKADDFIVSDKLISLMLSQVSENKQLTEVFSTLFSSDGSEVYLRPAELYITPGATADFYTVLESASRKGETAIGYRVESLARSADAAYGVHINPAKGESITFTAGDKVIVLAED